MKSEAVKSFYDDFLDARMIDYRIRGDNLRLRRATERVLKYVSPHSAVLDVGCGIGIVTEQMANAAPGGRVWGCDISDRNIWYARETVDMPNLTFLVADVLDETAKIRDSIDRQLDVITLIDVIEHIPTEKHTALFETLHALCSDEAVVVLTYPSPQYQRYLKEEEPDELQIIDEVVEFDHLRHAAEQSGFSLRHYSLERVWRKNQYVHCVMQADDSIEIVQEDRPDSVVRRIRNRLHWMWKQHVVFPYRKRKYVDAIFDES
jgi:cyclopropane fatty-acyl-phospholipid synthase-like methyltransferase